MNVILLAIAIIFQDIPFKPKEEFSIKLDYAFRQRPHVDQPTVVFEPASTSRNNTTLLPYLIIHIEIMEAAGTSRVKISDNKGTIHVSRKIKNGTILPLSIGFTDDAKDGVTANEYHVIFSDDSKKAVSKILLHIDKDGVFTVNSEQRGKF